MGRIVVGVDGSRASADALRWGLAQAERTGATLHVVMAWEPVNPDAWIPHDPPGTDPLAVTRAILTGFVSRVVGDRPHVALTTQALAGPPAAVLIEQARGADLLVVGSRGHGGFAGLLLGSVGVHCVTHAPCPVAVIRGAHAHAAHAAA